jgi:hypothetical protein
MRIPRISNEVVVSDDYGGGSDSRVVAFILPHTINRSENPVHRVCATRPLERPIRWHTLGSGSWCFHGRLALIGPDGVELPRPRKFGRRCLP